MSANLIKNEYFVVSLKKEFFLDVLLNIVVAESGCIIQQQCAVDKDMITVML